MKIFTGLFLSLLVLAACQEEYPKEITIHAPYAFATAPSAVNGAAFMVIENRTGMDDRLIEARSDIAEITDVHQNYIDPDDGMMMMRRVRGIELPIGGRAVLEPTGYHIMLIKLIEPLKIGDVFDLTLVFESAPAQTVQVEVVKPGSTMHAP